MLFLLLRVFK